MRRALVRIAVLLGGLVLLFILVTGPDLLALPLTLLLGWLPAGVRIAHAWHPGRTGTILFALAALTLLLGTHLFLRWLYPSLQSRQPAAQPRPWRWKWTLCGFGLFGFTLLAICSVVLTTHQLYWFSKSKDPWMVDPHRQVIAARHLALELETKAKECSWSASPTEAAFLSLTSPTDRRPAFESCQPIWISPDGRRLSAIILLPRRPPFLSRAWIFVLRPDMEISAHKLADLPQLLASLGITRGAGQPPGSPTLLP